MEKINISVENKIKMDSIMEEISIIDNEYPHQGYNPKHHLWNYSFNFVDNKIYVYNEEKELFWIIPFNNIKTDYTNMLKYLENKNDLSIPLPEHDACINKRLYNWTCWSKYNHGRGSGRFHLLNRSCSGCYNFYKPHRK